MRRAFIAMALLMSFSPFAFAEQFYASDFEGDALGQAPRGWELGFEGNGEGKVIADPVDPGNKVFAHSDLPHDQARHDVGGNIWVLGEESWQDYIVEYDAYFPEDFYMGVLFRFVDDDNFYLFDRRVGDAPDAPTFDFWRRQAGWVNVAAAGPFGAEPGEWYRFRLAIEGDTFEAYAKSQDDDTPFADMEPILVGSDGSFTSGKFGLYGLIYIDNIVIGETEADIVAAVEPGGKLSVTWGQMKR